MKHLSSTSRLLSALVLLCGCGAGGYGGGGYKGAPGGGIPAPTPSGQNTADNWQFRMTSTVSEAPPFTIAGSINQSGSSVSGAVHVDGSNCFDRLTAMGLTGTFSDNNLSLTSTSVVGQVTAFTGGISDNTFIGTYTINGGCASGDEGNITGVKVPSLTGNWAGDLTSQTGDTNRLVVTLAQGAATSEGIFGLTGSAFFEVGNCFKSAKIASGTFPSGSYVTGSSVSLEIETDNGVIVFLGEAKGDGLIRGNYALEGSTCESAGTGYLSPWEY